MKKSLNRLFLFVFALIFSLEPLSNPELTSFAQALNNKNYLPFVSYTLPPPRKANIPYLPGNIIADHYSEMAIFWFGQVDSSSNYADVRVAYNDEGIVFILTIFDRLLWFDPPPLGANFTSFDSTSISLAPTGDLNNAYRFTVQINRDSDPESQYQLSERGTASGWVISPLSFTTGTGLRWQDYTTGGLNNNQNNRGWGATFSIPFTSLGLNNKPSAGTEWKMAVALHDRDDEAGSVILNSSWPENASPNQVNTWGGLHFGLSSFTPPSINPAGTTTIRNKLNNVYVPDAAMGGTIDKLCPGDPTYIWNNWGNANFGSYPDLNIQNQSDYSDWPCFSKYYITFPLNSIPPNRIILNAVLILHQRGNSGPLELAQPSYIHVFTVKQDWSETSITWNNAPLAFENVAQAWVSPSQPCGGPGQIPWPCTPRQWDVTRAVAEAYQAGSPARLALYSSDSAYHSGKFFTSSNTGDWNENGRPTLVITWGNP